MHTILQNEEQKGDQRQRDEIRGATREINNLKCEMHEIKSMLKTLLERETNMAISATQIATTNTLEILDNNSTIYRLMLMD